MIGDFFVNLECLLLTVSQVTIVGMLLRNIADLLCAPNTQFPDMPVNQRPKSAIIFHQRSYFQIVPRWQRLRINGLTGQVREKIFPTRAFRVQILRLFTIVPVKSGG